MPSAMHVSPTLVSSALLTVAALLLGCSAQQRAEQVKMATESVARLQEGVVDFATNKQHWPSKIEDLKVDGDPMPGISYAVGEGGVVAVYFAEGSALPGAQLVYTPTQDAQGGVTWTCATKNLDVALKPQGCL